MSEKYSLIKNIFVKHFFDFFMLFLAIWLGFIADNFRSELNDHNTATALASELVEDIGLDTVSIHKMILYCTSKINKLDSLYVLIDDDKTVFDDSLIYYYSAHINIRPWLERNGHTFALFSNIGYLNSFTKDAALALTKYDIAYKKTILVMEHERGIVDTKILPFQQQIFHTENFESLSSHNKLIVRPALRNWNNDTRWIYHNYLTEIKIENQHIKYQYNDLLEKARYTIQILKKEYTIQ